MDTCYCVKRKLQNSILPFLWNQLVDFQRHHNFTDLRAGLQTKGKRKKKKKKTGLWHYE